MLDYIRQHKVFSLVIFLNIIAILIVVLVIVIYNTKTATVDLMVAPSDAVVELNGKQFENLKSHNVSPGDYHIKISMEGMQPKEFDLDIEDGDFKRIWTYLLDDDGGFGYYMSHPDDAIILNDVADDDVKRFLAEYNKLNAIQEVLPLQYSNTFDENATEVISISVRWGIDDECDKKAFCLIVHDFTGKNNEKALQMIRDAGFDPNDYELVYEKGDDE